MKKQIKDYCYMILGSVVIGIGITFFAKADLGADALTTVEQGISRVLKAELSVGQILFNLASLVVLFILDKKRVSLQTALTAFVITFGIKIGELLVFDVNSLLSRYIYMLLGLVLVGLGIAIGAKSPSGVNAYDGSIMYLSEKFNKPFGSVRAIGDAIFLVIGILLGGSYGVGTIVAIFLQGYLASFFMKVLKV